MKLQDIVSKYHMLQVYEERKRTADYEELVFYKNEMKEWEKIFSEILGPAQKPMGVRPTKEDLSMTQDFGGIQADQMLFKKDFEDATVMAMFWPWQDNTYCTLKVVYLKK